MEARIASGAFDALASLSPVSGKFREKFGGRNPEYSLRESVSDIETAIQQGKFPGVDLRAFRECIAVTEAVAKDKVLMGSTIPEHHVAALLLFTSESGSSGTSLYDIMNQSLRSPDRSKLTPFMSYMWLLLHAMMACPSYEKMSGKNMVYRGMKGRLDMSGYVKGRTITWSQFSSTSASLESQQEFVGTDGNRVMLHIILHTGRGRFIGSNSFFENECEVLLPPNTRLQVMGLMDAGHGLSIIHLEEQMPLDPILEFPAEAGAGTGGASSSGSASTLSATAQALGTPGLQHGGYESEYPAARAFLASKGWPPGLQKFLIQNISRSPRRFFLCDDSGSMITNDGNRFVQTAGGKTMMVQCTRWAELTDTLRFHATLSAHLRQPAQFRLLNSAPPINVGNPQASDAQQASSFAQLADLLDEQPSGATPLCRHIREIIVEIEALEAQLRRDGQKAVIVIFTDGESSDGNVATAMQPLRHLPVHVIVRLCTDSKEIRDYWNNIDNQLELSMDVLDDLVGEAREVAAVNSWLIYGEPLHRLREYGTPMKELDMLDESKLSVDNLLRLCSVVLDVPMGQLPRPDTDPRGFRAVVRDRKGEKTWSPLHKAMRDWVDADTAVRVYGGGSGALTGLGSLSGLDLSLAAKIGLAVLVLVIAIIWASL